MTIMLTSNLMMEAILFLLMKELKTLLVLRKVNSLAQVFILHHFMIDREIQEYQLSVHIGDLNLLSLFKMFPMSL